MTGGDETTISAHLYRLPYAVCCAVMWVLVALSPRPHPVQLAVALVLQVLVALLLARAGGRRPSTSRFAIGSLGFLVSLALLRNGSVSNSGYSALVLLPIVLAAMRARRLELAGAILGGALCLFIPVLVVGGAQYRTGTLRGATLLVMIGAVVGCTVILLVERLRASERELGQLVAQQQRQLRFEDALRRVAMLVASGAPSGELFGEVAKQLALLTETPIGAVAVRFDASSRTGEVVGGYSPTGADPTGQLIDLDGPTASAQVFRHGGTRRARAYDQPSEAWVRDLDVQLGVAAPIVVGGRMWGALGILFAEAEPAVADLERRLERFAELVVMAIANAEAFDQLTVAATTDPLTRIANRRAFDERLQVELERASRHSRPLSVALFDVDHFKQINDRHGHLSGDRALSALAHVISGNARAGEVVARLGGDEFAWLMPETEGEDAVQAADRIRGELSRIGIELTVSVGIGFNDGGRSASASQLLTAADAALYAAKAQGRDQTVLAPPSRSLKLA